jgi:hypothetical protein
MTREALPLFRYYGHTLLPEERPLENSGLKVLDKLSLKVTPPNEFNDVFELAPVIDRPVTKDEARIALKTAIGGQISKSGLPAALGNDLAEVVLGLKSNQAGLNYVTQQSISPVISQRYGVVCFSAVPNDLLMWAHCAANNHGIMLEFDPAAPLFNGPGFFKVEYDDNRLVSEPQSMDEMKQVAALASRKSPVWENEVEHRLIVSLDQTIKVETDGGRPIHLLSIKPEWIRSVTVGQRVSLGIKNEINQLLRRPDLAHLHAERYRMVMAPKAFQLSRERITNF